MNPEENPPTRAEFQALIAQYQRREQELLDREQEHVDREADLVNRLHALNARLAAAALAPPPPPPAPAAPPPPAPIPAPVVPVDLPVEKPPYFDGKPSELTDFLTHLHVFFLTQPTKYPDDTSRCLAASLFLRGNAYKWIQPSLLQFPLPPHLTDYPTFVANLKATFADPNEQLTAARSLQTLRQQTSVSAYVAEFSRLSAIVGWQDDVLLHLFYQGLKDEVKDQLALADRPDTLPAIKAAALRADYRIMERRAERGRPFPARQPYLRPAPPLAPPIPLPPVAPLVPPLLAGPAPMDLGANRPAYRRLTPEERDRRLRCNLCLYCGLAGHRATDCPTRPPRPQRLAAADGAVLPFPPPPLQENDFPRVE